VKRLSLCFALGPSVVFSLGLSTISGEGPSMLLTVCHAMNLFRADLNLPLHQPSCSGTTTFMHNIIHRKIRLYRSIRLLVAACSFSILDHIAYTALTAFPKVKTSNKTKCQLVLMLRHRGNTRVNRGSGSIRRRSGQTWSDSAW